MDGLVFWPSAGIIILFITITLLVGEPMNQVFSKIQASISDYGGWFFVITVNAFLFFDGHNTLLRIILLGIIVI